MSREIQPCRNTHNRVVPSGLRALLAAVALLGLLLASPAAGSPETLRRGLGNIVGGPMDMLLSPISGIAVMATNLQEIDDTPGVRITYALPGWIWLTGLSIGSGGIRLVTGFLEVLPGVILFPFESDVEPLFDPVEDAAALIDLENPLADVENPWVYKNPLLAPFAIRPKWAVNYTRADF